MTESSLPWLHDLLVEEAEAHEPVPDWHDVQRRAAGRSTPVRQSPRRWMAAVAAAVVLAIGAAALMVDVRDEDRDVGTVDEVEAPGSGSFGSGPRSAPVDLPSGAPLGSDELVAIIEPADVAVLTSDAVVVRTLVSADTTTSVVLSPDRRTVLVTQHAGDCGDRLLAVAADGTSGPVEVRDGVRAAALSPSGRTLGVIHAGDCGRGPLVVELVPVAGGRTEQYVSWSPAVEVLPDQVSPGYVDHPPPTTTSVVVWPTSLAFVSEREVLAGPLSWDPDRPGVRALARLDFEQQAVAPAVSDLGPSAQLGSVDRAGDGRVTAIEYCCSGDREKAVRLVTIRDGQIVDAAGEDLLFGASRDRRDFLWTAGRGPDGSVFSISGLTSSHLVIDGVERSIALPWPEQRLIYQADW